MNKLCKIARGLDTFFKIVYWLCLLLAAVFVVVTVAFAFMETPFLQVGTDAFLYSYNGIQFRFPGADVDGLFYIENAKAALLVVLAMSVVGFALALPAIRIIRRILKPMKESKPFEAGIGGKFKALGVFAIVYGVIGNAADFIAQQLLLNTLQGIEGQELIVSVNRDFDLSFVLAAAVLFLCSYIFRYGEELQTQADETL